MLKKVLKRLSALMVILLIATSLHLPALADDSSSNDSNDSNTESVNDDSDENESDDDNSDSNDDNSEDEDESEDDNSDSNDDSDDIMKRRRLLNQEITAEQIKNRSINRSARHLYEIRWGKLDNRREACREMDEDDLKEALEEGDIPEDCRAESTQIDYKGEISVNTGELEIYKTFLFENNDEVIVEKGNAVQFNSTIFGHNDGLILKYTPSDENSDEKAQITVKIGNLDKTFNGNEALGRHNIGNGHTIDIKQLANILPSHAKADQERIIENKLKVRSKVTDLQSRIQKLRLLDRAGDDAEDEVEDVIDEVDDYNFDDQTANELEAEIEAVIESLSDGADEGEVRAKIKELKDKLKELKDKAKDRKFRQKLIPFRDTDDDDWFTEFASAAKERGIFTGYKDDNGNELGEFRPSRDITVAEILKVGLETSQKGQANGTPNLGSAASHWAKGYVKKGEELELDIVTENDLDLNRPATRSEVVRMMLEALGVDPEAVSNTDFSDVSANHKNAAFIQYAKKMGIVSGDSGKTTFRPDAPINRAEAAKIANLIVELFFSEEVANQ